MHEVDSRQSQFQLGMKFCFRKIALDAPSFLSLRIQNQYGGSPQRIEAVEVNGMFFDVGFNRNEVVIDEG